MPQPQTSPVWASTALEGLLAGPWRDAVVIVATPTAAYVRVAENGPAPGMMALLSRQAVRLPVGACVGGGQLPDVGSTLRIGHGLVAAAPFSWRPVRWWDPRPRLDASALLQHGPRLLRVIGNEPPSAFGLPVPHALNIAGALAVQDKGPALATIGLGPGLTPAADDVVAGALAALALTDRLQDSIRAVIRARAATRTTALSAALLDAAGRGQVIPQAARLLTVLATGGSPGRLRAAATRLFRVGSTSGHDLCAGMAGALASAA